ncbi:MAG: hypothetical protein K0Q95_1042 [Bacteroidota bacterium]|jgi:hypothetical protein|nr:hypothetical protein [Bacteroidota bacterium]
MFKNLSFGQVFVLNIIALIFKTTNMKDKINAYHKIRRTIQGSRNELHLHTCTIMIGIFIVRYKDESMRVLLKNEVENRRNEILTKRSRYTNALS